MEDGNNIKRHKELLPAKPVKSATIIYDQSNIVRSFSAIAVELTGYEQDEIVGSSVEQFQKYLEVSDELEIGKLYEIRTKKGEIKVVLVDKSFMEGVDGELLIVVNLLDQSYSLDGCLNSVAEKKMDINIGVYNKIGIVELLDNEMKRANRYKHPLSIIYVRIDAFLFIDEVHGVGGSELVLQTLAIILKNETRDVDFIGRLSEDTFVVILPATSEPSAMNVSQRIKEAARNYSAEDTPFAITSVAVGMDYYAEIDVLENEAKRVLDIEAKNRSIK